MSRVVVEPVYSLSQINSNNHHEYAPFTVLKDLVYVYAEWWYKLPQRQRERILRNFGTHFGYCIRHRSEIKEQDKKPTENDAFWNFFNAYIDSYVVSMWYDCLEPPNCISIIDKKTIKGLEKLSKLCSYRPRKLSEDDIDFYCLPARKSLEKFIDEHKQTGVFMKLSDKSGKYSRKLTPKFSFLEIVEEIVHNKSLIQCLLRHGENSSLLLKPWVYEINNNNEFRVIVIDCFVSAISQQQCYKYVGLTGDQMEVITQSIFTFFDKMKKDLPYRSCVLDVWVDCDNVTHLIEINPGEMWASSGSALFQWVIDREKIYQQKKTYVRYIDIQNPLIRSKPYVSGMSTDSLLLSPK